MASLANQTISSTYDGLIKTSSDNAVPVSGVQALEDGSGNALALSVGRSGNGVTVSGNLAVDTNTLYVDAANNRVGVGTSSPADDLQVNSIIRVSGTQPKIRFEETDTTNENFEIRVNAGDLIVDKIDDGFSSGRTERMRIDSSGRVSINDTVSGSVATNYNPELLVGGTIVARSLTANAALIEIGGDADSAFITSGKQDGSQTARAMRFEVGTSEAMRIDSSGNITQTASDASLSVNASNAGGTASIGINGLGSNGSSTAGTRIDGIPEGSGSAASMAFVTRDSGGTRAERMRINSSGNVGIGVVPSAWRTTGETKALQISTRGAIWESSNNVFVSNNLYFDSTGAFKYIETNPASYFNQDPNGEFVFNNVGSGTAGATATLSERMRITSGGDVLFGTTGTPDGTSVYGSAFTSDTANTMTLRLATSTSGAKNLAAFYNPNGNVGKIQVSGTATSYITSSDYRLKENVVPMEGALDRVDALKPSRFNFIADAETTVDGFLAHEVAEVVPEAISGEKDAVDEEGNPVYQGIDQSKIVPLLVGAIKELRAEIELLKAK